MPRLVARSLLAAAPLAASLGTLGGCSTQQTSTASLPPPKPAYCATEPSWRMPSCPCGCMSSLCIGTEAVIGKTSGTLVCDSTTTAN